MSSFLKAFSTILTVILSSHITLAQEDAQRLCPHPWQSAVGALHDCTLQEFTLTTWNVWTSTRRPVKANIRSGFLAENPEVPFRGNVLYFEGLADSMVNHQPLFSKLTQAGYRVIAFDYMGQGGSSGTMNDTRIFEIGTLGDKIWNMHAKDLQNYPKKNIIGWSTGGLAAYVHAVAKSDVSNIVLIAPGIVPNKKVGEQRPLEFKFNQITLPTLTTQVYVNGVENPHLDPIKPNSPLEIMDFSVDLMATAFRSRLFTMSPNVNGFVLLSGDNDTYVNARKTFTVLKKTAPHFSVRQYPNALHEIDNEAEPHRSRAHRDILDFLNRNN